MAIDAKELLLYAITDRAWTEKCPLEEQIALAISGGATIVQLREKGISDEEYIRRAESALKVCRSLGVKLIIDDNVKVAVESGADGVHVGIEDTPVCDIRGQVREYYMAKGLTSTQAEERASAFIVGATAKTIEQAQSAQGLGADYLGSGAVFPSPTKKNAIRITPQKLREITASVNIPVVAIGGITADNASELAHSGICGIAVVSAIFGAPDIAAASRRLKAVAKEVVS